MRGGPTFVGPDAACHLSLFGFNSPSSIERTRRDGGLSLTLQSNPPTRGTLPFGPVVSLEQAREKTYE
jgi:hypothetical protein